MKKKVKIYMTMPDKKTPSIHYRTPDGYDTYHPASSVPFVPEYEVELEDGTWRKMIREDLKDVCWEWSVTDYDTALKDLKQGD